MEALAGSGESGKLFLGGEALHSWGAFIYSTDCYHVPEMGWVQSWVLGRHTL